MLLIPGTMTSAPDYADRTFKFACDIVQFYRAIMKLPHFPFGIARQVLKAGTSIGANIEEARKPSRVVATPPQSPGELRFPISLLALSGP